MELQIIQSKIYRIRGQKVMLDFDLAGLYQEYGRMGNLEVTNCDIKLGRYP